MGIKLTARNNDQGENSPPFREFAPEHESDPDEHSDGEGFLPARGQLDATSLPHAISDPFLPNSERRTERTKTFAAILDDLRTDEDRFYFLIEGGQQSGMRVPIESEEMVLGWQGNGQQLTFDVALITSLLAIVRKDWSGVMLLPQTAGVAVNDDIVEAGRRLREGDRLKFPANEGASELGQVPTLVFREPASLVILDSLMPRSIPQEIDNSHLAQRNGHSKETGTALNSVRRVTALLRNDREYFGVFTFIELSLMAIGTIVGAVIIFLVLNDS